MRYEIHTPRGSFKTMQEAAEAHGVTKQYISLLVNDSRKESYYRGSEVLNKAETRQKELETLKEELLSRGARYVVRNPDYMITPDGRVYNIVWGTEKVVSLINRYKTVTLNGKNRSLHRVLAESFIDNPDNLPCVRHLNDDPLDNRLENLQWGTEKDNAIDRELNKKRK